MSYGDRFKVGDIVLQDRSKVCIWEITAIFRPDRGDAYATLKYLGGQRLAGWNETSHAALESLVPAERFLNEMEILAWAAKGHVE